MTFNSELQKLTEAKFQLDTRLFVQREIVCCVSMLITALIEWSPTNEFYNFFETFLRYDEEGNHVEIFEYWFVSDYLAEKLEAKGEIIAHGFFGHTVWGRTCTGQAIYMDHVIRDIYSELKGS